MEAEEMLAVAVILLFLRWLLSHLIFLPSLIIFSRYLKNVTTFLQQGLCFQVLTCCWTKRPVSSSPAPNWLYTPVTSSSPPPNWLNAPGSSSSPAPNRINAQGSSSGVIVTRSLKLYLPAHKYPNHQSVAQIGDSLKQLEAKTNCRITLRGRSSMKDILEEETMRGRPGFEHLNEPLHLLIEADLPIDIVNLHLVLVHGELQRLLTPWDSPTEQNLFSLKTRQPQK